MYKTQLIHCYYEFVCNKTLIIITVLNYNNIFIFYEKN